VRCGQFKSRTLGWHQGEDAEWDNCPYQAANAILISSMPRRLGSAEVEELVDAGHSQSSCPTHHPLDSKRLIAPPLDRGNGLETVLCANGSTLPQSSAIRYLSASSNRCRPANPLKAGELYFSLLDREAYAGSPSWQESPKSFWGRSSDSGSCTPAIRLRTDSASSSHLSLSQPAPIP
jgi:hypothetical protein